MAEKQFAAMGSEFESDRAKKAVKIATGSKGGYVAGKTDGDNDDKGAQKERAPQDGKIAARKQSKPNDQIKSSDEL